MTNNTSILSSSATLADVINAALASKLSDSAKMQFVAKASSVASDEEAFKKVIVTLNYYLEDSEEFYDGDGSDISYDEREVLARKAKEEAEAKALAEKKAKEKKDLCSNAAMQNLMLRGMKPFINGGEPNPEFQKALNEEIRKLMKGERIYTMDTGECFVPDMEKNGLTRKQIAVMEKADIDDHKSNKVVSNEDRRPMSDGGHCVKIAFYQERKGKEGKPDYAIINVVEEATGKRAWLSQWTLADPASVDRTDMWKCRYNQLKSISENNDDCLEGLTEDECVEYLREHEFLIFTYKTDKGMLVYTDQERYEKFLAKQSEAQLKNEEASKREAQLDSVGLRGAEDDVSIEETPWKYLCALKLKGSRNTAPV